MHYQWLEIPLSSIPPQASNIQVQVPESNNNFVPVDINSQQIPNTKNTNSLLAQPSLNLNENSILSEEIEDFLSGSEEDKEKSFIPLAQEYDEFDPLEFLGIYKSQNRLKISPSVNFNSYDSLDEEENEDRSEDEKEIKLNDLKDHVKKENLTNNIDDHTSNDINDPYNRYDYFSKMRSKFPNNLEDSSNNIFVKNIDNNIKSNLFSISENDSRLEKSGDFSKDNNKDNNFSKILDFQDFNSKIKSNPCNTVNQSGLKIDNHENKDLDEKNVNYIKKEAIYNQSNDKVNSSNLIRKNSDFSVNNGINENSSDIKAKRRINFQNNFNPTEEVNPIANKSPENHPESINPNNNNPNNNNFLSKDFKDLKEKINNSNIEKLLENSNKQITDNNANITNTPHDSNLNISYFQSLNKNRTFDNYLNSSKDKYSSIGQVFSQPREDISNFNENTNLFNAPNFIINEESMNIMKHNNNSIFMTDNMFYSNHLLSNLFKNPEDTRRFNNNILNNQNSSISYKNLEISSPIKEEQNTINIKNTADSQEKKLLNRKTKKTEDKISNKNKNKKKRNSPIKLDEILDHSQNLSKNKSRKSRSHKEKEIVSKNDGNFQNTGTNYPNFQNYSQGFIPGQSVQSGMSYNPNMKIAGNPPPCYRYPNFPLLNYNNPHNVNISTANPYIFNQNNFFHGFNPQMDSRGFNTYYNLPVDIPHPSSLNPANQIPFYPQMDQNFIYRMKIDKSEKMEKFVPPKDNKNFN